MRVLTEGDVFRLIAHCKLPQGLEFNRWIYDEVLPSIRKTGSYYAKPDDGVTTLQQQFLKLMERIAERDSVIDARFEKIVTLLRCARPQPTQRQPAASLTCRTMAFQALP